MVDLNEHLREARQHREDVIKELTAIRDAADETLKKLSAPLKIAVRFSDTIKPDDNRRK